MNNIRTLFILTAVATALCLDEEMVPSISYSQLSSALNNGDKPVIEGLKDAGGRYSVFEIKDLPSSLGYEAGLQRLRESAPDCIGRNHSLPQASLADGSKRRTFATSTNSDYPKCLHGNLGGLTIAFAAVESLVARLVDNIVGHKLSYYETPEKIQKSVPLAQAPHKDHIHVYTNTKKEENMHGSHEGHGMDFLVPFHIDNGMYLIITPFAGLSLQVTLSNGKNVSTEHVGNNSLLVLFGAGLSDWMLQGMKERELFWPVPHGVPSLVGSGITYRSVYARMKVAPAKAIPASTKVKPTKLHSFHKVFMQTSRQSDSQVCSVDLKSPFMGLHKKDSWRDTMDETCAHGEAYCWMGCYPLPQACPSTDHARCFSSVTNITCSTLKGGKPMDPTCKWECKPEEQQQFKVREYCNGKMDMLMFGFETSGNKENPCVILFIEAWTLDSRLKFYIGCMGVLVLGFSIEALIALRRLITGRKLFFLTMKRPARKALIVSTFGLNLFLGYMAMLVAMTYSVELFFCTMFGLIIGHATFNVNMAVGESIDPCCASSQNNAALSQPLERPSSILLTPYNDDHQEDCGEMLLSPSSARGKNVEGGSTVSTPLNGACCSSTKSC